jgi:hypothetical protein
MHGNTTNAQSSSFRGGGGGFGGGFGATPSASASASGTAAAAAAVTTASSFANGAHATTATGDVATTPVDGTGAAINTNQTAAEAATSLNCSLAVPANALTAAGLATPWQLGDGCSMANAGTEGAFVEATILSPAGQLQVYSPLVVTAGTTPAVAPVAPTIAAGSEVIINVGFNGTNLFLTGAGATAAGCVDADGQSVIGQVSACNAVPFYNLARQEIARGTLRIPAGGTATDGQACQTTRSFGVIDQDQSDNVVSQYLVTSAGTTAVNNPANAAKLTGATVLANGSDDALLSEFMDPAEGCTAFTAADTTYPKATAPSAALNELSAQANQRGTIALVPTNDEMTLVGGQMSITKTNIYRSLVDQPLLSTTQSAAAVAASYCQNLTNIQPARNALDATADDAFASPVPTVGSNLGTFLGNRLSMSFVNLGCSNYGLKNPVTATLDGTGIATAVTYSTTQQAATGATPATSTSTGFGGGFGGAPNPFAGQTTGTQAQNPTTRTRWQAPSRT